MGDTRQAPQQVVISQDVNTLQQSKNVQPVTNLNDLYSQFGSKRVVPNALSISFTAGATTNYIMFNAASLHAIGSGETAFSVLSNTIHTNMVSVIGCGAYFLVSGFRIKAPDSTKLSGFSFTLGRADVNGGEILDPRNQDIVSQLSTAAYQSDVANISMNFAIDMYTFIKIGVTNTDNWVLTFNIVGISNRPW